MLDEKDASGPINDDSPHPQRKAARKPPVEMKYPPQRGLKCDPEL
jgi:hypothetical protein